MEIYPYAVAKIKVRENRLLSNDHLKQLAEESMERIVADLMEREYPFDMVERYEDYEIVLKKAEEDMYKLIKEIIEENNIAEIFLSKNDFYNMKLILKSKAQGKEYQDKLLNSGTVSKEEISFIMENEEYDRLSRNRRQAILDARRGLSKNEDAIYY